MKNYRFQSYTSRIEKQLPPISTCQIDFLKRKYEFQLREIYVDLFESLNDSEVDGYLYWMFYELFYDENKYKIKHIIDLETWIIQYILDYSKNKVLKSKVNHCLIERVLIGGRMHRACEIDGFNRKYFKSCVEKLIEIGLSKPLQIARKAFEDAENFHIEFMEDDRSFLESVRYIIESYCLLEKRPTIESNAWVEFFENSMLITPKIQSS